MLDAFVRLADASNASYVRFAKRWGLLSLCDRHGLPYTHAPAHIIDKSAPWLRLKGPRNENCELALEERVGHWRLLARRTQAVLTVATVLHWSDSHPEEEARLGNKDDWSAIDDEAEHDWLDTASLQETKTEPASLISMYVEWTNFILAWLGSKNARISSWWDGQPSAISQRSSFYCGRRGDGDMLRLWAAVYAESYAQYW